MQRRGLVSLLGISLLALACSSGVVRQGDGPGTTLTVGSAQTHPLHLYVSNQSFDIDPVDIRIDSTASGC